jgi:hypothetical protein
MASGRHDLALESPNVVLASEFWDFAIAFPGKKASPHNSIRQVEKSQALRRTWFLATIGSIALARIALQPGETKDCATSADEKPTSRNGLGAVTDHDSPFSPVLLYFFVVRVFL